MENFVSKLSRYSIKKGAINEIDYEIYKYGVAQLIFNMINIVTIVVIGLILNELIELIVFSLFYLILRSFAGGYHANSRIKCYFFSVFQVLLVGISIKSEIFNIHETIFLVLIGTILLLKLSPVESKNKKLEQLECEYYRKKMIKILLIIILLWLIATICSSNLYLVFGLIVVVTAGVVTLGKIDNIIHKKRGHHFNCL